MEGSNVNHHFIRSVSAKLKLNKQQLGEVRPQGLLTGCVFKNKVQRFTLNVAVGGASQGFGVEDKLFLVAPFNRHWTFSIDIQYFDW